MEGFYHLFFVFLSGWFHWLHRASTMGDLGGPGASRCAGYLGHFRGEQELVPQHDTAESLPSLLRNGNWWWRQVSVRVGDWGRSEAGYREPLRFRLCRDSDAFASIHRDVAPHYNGCHVGHIWWESKVEEGYSPAAWESLRGPLCLGTLLLFQSPNGEWANILHNLAGTCRNPFMLDIARSGWTYRKCHKLDFLNQTLQSHLSVGLDFCVCWPSYKRALYYNVKVTFL